MKICYGRRPKSGNGRLRDFASKMSPFLIRFLAVARLTHFHRSGTWLAPTDISQTFSTLLLYIFITRGLGRSPKASPRVWRFSRKSRNQFIEQQSRAPKCRARLKYLNVNNFTASHRRPDRLRRRYRARCTTSRSAPRQPHRTRS